MQSRAAICATPARASAGISRSWGRALRRCCLGGAGNSGHGWLLQGGSTSHLSATDQPLADSVVTIRRTGGKGPTAVSATTFAPGESIHDELHGQTLSLAAS